MVPLAKNLFLKYILNVCWLCDYGTYQISSCAPSGPKTCPQVPQRAHGLVQRWWPWFLSDSFQCFCSQESALLYQMEKPILTNHQPAIWYHQCQEVTVVFFYSYQMSLFDARTHANTNTLIHKIIFYWIQRYNIHRYNIADSVVDIAVQYRFVFIF